MKHERDKTEDKTKRIRFYVNIFTYYIRYISPSHIKITISEKTNKIINKLKHDYQYFYFDKEK